MQIKKKFIKNNAVDGAKLLLLNDQSVRALDASDNVVELMKLDASGDLRMLVLPKASVDPSDAEHLARKGYVDTEVSGALSSANSYTDAQIAATVGAAPDLLNTLQELSAALGDDENFASTIASQISALDGRLDTLEGDESVADSVEQRISERLNPSDSRRFLYVDLTAPGGWHKESESLSYTPDGTVFKPFNTIQSAINYGYTQLDDMTYGNSDANHDFVVVIRALAAGDSTGANVGMQTGNNARPLSISIDPDAIRTAAGLNALSAAGGGKCTIMVEDGLINGIIPIKLVGTITIAGANTTRIKMKNIFIEAPGGVANTVLTINGTAGRHYFENCGFNGVVQFSGAWRRWHDFTNGFHYGLKMQGTPAADQVVYLTQQQALGQQLVDCGIININNCERIHSVVHNAGVVSIAKSAFTNTAGLVSTAASPGALYLRDVMLHNGAAYCALTKTGSAPYLFTNVTRSAAAETVAGGARMALGASAGDFKFVPGTAADWSSAGSGEGSVKDALDELKDEVKTVTTIATSAASAKETFVLTAQNISDGYVDLAITLNTLVANSVVAFVDRLAIHENEDFILADNGTNIQFFFSGALLPGGEEALAEGDVIRVTYQVKAA